MPVLVLQSHLPRRLRSSSVVTGFRDRLMTTSPSREGEQMQRIGRSRLQDDRDEQAPHLGHGQRDQVDPLFFERRRSDEAPADGASFASARMATSVA